MNGNCWSCTASFAQSEGNLLWVD